MRILIGVESFLDNISGVVVYTRRLATFLAERGHKVTILTTSSKKLRRLDKNGFEVITVEGFVNPFRKKLYISHPTNFINVKNLVREINPDVIHLQDPGILNNLILREGKKNNIPVISHHHFPMEMVLSYFNGISLISPAIEFFVETYLEAFYNDANLVIAPSYFLKDLLKSWNVTTSVKVISNGVDLKRFRSSQNINKKNNPFFRKLKISLQNKVVLYVGRFEKDKNIMFLFRCIPELLKKNPDTIFIFLGSGREFKKAQKFIKTHKLAKNVRLIKKLIYEEDGLPNLYNLADIFWLASSEAQSLAALEGMASALPIVTTDRGGLPEIIKDNNAGLLANDNNQRSFVKTVSTLLNNDLLRKKLSVNAAAAVQKHSLKDCLLKVEEEYKQLLNLLQ